LRSSPELSSTIDALLEKQESTIMGLALIAAAEKRDAIPRIKDLAADDKQPMEVRRAAVQSLGRILARESVAALEGIVQSKNTPLPLEAVQALANQIPLWSEASGTKAALKLLQTVFLDKSASAELRLAALSVLSESRPGTVWLLDAHKNKQLHD